MRPAASRFPARLWGTSGFRLALLYALVFAASSAVLFAVLHWGTVGTMRRQLADAVAAEFAALADDQAREGTAGLARVLERRAAEVAAHPGARYGLFGAGGGRLAGDLPLSQSDGWSEIDLDGKGTDAQDAYLLALARQLPDGTRLVVARDARQLRETEELLLNAFLWAGGATLLLGLGGGILVARGFLRRVDAIAATAEAIARGELDRRVAIVAGKAAPQRDEMERLATAINAMLDRIRDLMEELRHATSAIAHDLRTPLARLRQGLEDARARAAASADYETAVDAAIAETDAILRTFTALLRVAQVESGSRRTGFAPVDLSALVTEVAEAYGPSIEDSGRLPETDIASGVVAQGDRELLIQMLANLLENAIRHTPPGSRVAVRLPRPPGGSDASPVLIVEDDGPGIPEPERARVLRRFHRLDSSRSGDGSGLGLALVAAVAELHGAALELGDAMRDGRGLRVGIRFPATSATVSAPGGLAFGRPLRSTRPKPDWADPGSTT
ncbi:MAG TPA: HAMP domain-containing sensor histidine kinase [Crenalkalicoccus sp.]|nr:HAMP domain-containing sensor histidine kinase [Crenalkalicoccus sp.]